jgi:hypothetical protein
MNHIQDIILTAGSLVFIAALLPTVFSKDKPALITGITTGIVLVVFGGVYMSLDLWFSAVVTFITASCWFTLAVQKHIKTSKSKSQ